MLPSSQGRHKTIHSSNNIISVEKKNASQQGSRSGWSCNGKHCSRTFFLLYKMLSTLRPSSYYIYSPIYYFWNKIYNIVIKKNNAASEKYLDHKVFRFQT